MLTAFGLVTALLTAFYTFRLVFVTFWGPFRGDRHHGDHVHEPSYSMTVPLIILAVLSIVTGYVGIPDFLQPVFSREGGASLHEGSGATAIMVLATVMGLLGIAGAYYAYVLHPSLPERWARRWQTAYELSLNKWYADEVYDRLFVRPTFHAAVALWKRMDVATIDAAVNGVARAIAWGGWLLRLVQSGQAQHYALGMALGAVGCILTVLMVDVRPMHTGGFPWLTVLIFLPLAGAGALFLVKETHARAMALVITVADFLLALPLWWLFDSSSSHMQFVEHVQWITSPPIHYSLGVDGISLPSRPDDCPPHAALCVDFLGVDHNQGAYVHGRVCW